MRPLRCRPTLPSSPMRRVSRAPVDDAARAALLTLAVLCLGAGGQLPWLVEIAPVAAAEGDGASEALGGSVAVIVNAVDVNAVDVNAVDVNADEEDVDEEDVDEEDADEASVDVLDDAWTDIRPDGSTAGWPGVGPGAGVSDTLDVDGARTLLDTGRYDEALVALDRLLAGEGEHALDADEVARAASLRFAALATVGRYDEAREAIPDPGAPTTAPGTTASAVELLTGLGLYDEARDLLAAGLEHHPGAPELLVAAAELDLELGDREAAIERLRAVDVPSTSDAAATPERLVAAGRAAWLRSQLRQGDEFQRAKELFQEAYRRDPDDHQARRLAAALYLEKYESKLARGELDPILRRNVMDPDANVLLARIDFADGRYRTLEDFAERALSVNPQHLGALEMLATIQLADEEVHAALATLESGLAINPRCRPLLSLRAAMYAQIGDQRAAEEEAAALLEDRAPDAEVYLAIGGALDRLRRYDEAAGWYRRAVLADPGHARAASALGLLYMRDGREEEAREWLDRGFELDPYNMRAYNMRLIFKQLDAYERFETEHFVIKVDDGDRALVPELSRQLEAIYDEQVARFGFTPERKTTIEVFHTRDLLSGRLVGLPGVQGIPAACFGPVIASESPRLWDGRANWRNVMAHEFGHVLALGRTQKRVPHWFTEGLSTTLEERVAPREWDQIARSAIEQHEMLSFTELNHGFTRSRSMMQRSLAYYKSSWVVGHLIESRGWETLLDWLDDYAAGHTTEEIVDRRLGESPHDFAAEIDSLFLAHVEAAPIWEPTQRAELMASIREADEAPDDADARARMAERWMRRGELETAVSEALGVLETAPEHPQARFVMGHALLQQGEPSLALDYLEPLVANDSLMTSRPAGYLIVRDLGVIYAELEEDVYAEPYLEAAIAGYASDPEPYRKLAEVFERAGRIDEALDVLDRLTRSQPASVEDLERLAELAGRAGRTEVVAAALERTLWIEPFDVETARALAAASRDGGDLERARTALETVCLLDAEDVAAHASLVELCLEHGPVTTARRYAPRLLELDPESAVGRRALEGL